MKLTAKIAASYFGAEVRCAPYGGPPDRKIIGTMIGLNNDGIHVKFPEWQSHQHQVAIGVCQLILTPLDKISDEDAVEVCKFLYSNPALHNPERGKSVATVGDWHSTRKGVEVIDYLRSKGYDCGYANLNSLISAGVAVEKEIV